MLFIQQCANKQLNVHSPYQPLREKKIPQKALLSGGKLTQHVLILYSTHLKCHLCLPDMHCMVPQILKTSDDLKMKIINTLDGLVGFASGT